MSRKQPQAGDVIHSLGQKKVRRRRPGAEPRPDLLQGQFSLGTLFLLVTIASLGLAYFYYWGTATVEEVGKVQLRVQDDVENFPNNSAAEFVPLAAAVSSLVLAGLLGWLVYVQPVNHGLAIVWLVSCLSVLGLVLFIALPENPLANTSLKDLQWKQVFPIAALALSCTLPVGAIGGWCARNASRG